MRTMMDGNEEGCLAGPDSGAPRLSFRPGCDPDHSAIGTIEPYFGQLRFRSSRIRRQAVQHMLRLARRAASKRLKQIAMAAAVSGMAAIGFSAHAQGYYFINGQPAPLNVARLMAANGLPFGYYWLDARGNWGAVGNPRPLGNIYTDRDGAPRHRSLSERGLLYSPGELLR